MGMPEKYTAWRPNQEKAIEEIIFSQSPYVTQIAPTGCGKSLQYVTGAHASAEHAVILTSTKGLMRQLENDFAEIGMVAVKGKNSYMCKAESDGSSCEEGPCNAGFKCRFKDNGGCPYYDAIQAARGAPLTVTNYAFWMTYNKYAEKFPDPDLLICDEAHDLPQLVSDFLTSKINRQQPIIWSLLTPPENERTIGISGWAEWADAMLPRVRDKISDLKEHIKMADGGNKQVRRELRTFAYLLRNLLTMSKMNSQEWVMDVNEYSLEFAPIWPKEYTRDVLFLDATKVLLTSATVCEKTTEMLGIRPEDNQVSEFPHSFPKQNRELIFIPTVRLNIHAKPIHIRQWTSRIDQIIRPRLDRKGLIHTVSYERRSFVMAQSEFSDYMVSHTTGDMIKMLSRFMKADPPLIMVSPSMTTGIDLPDDTCRYQIIGKVPWPDTRNKIVKARTDEDPEYGAYIAAQQLVQAVGRGVRSVDDWCENFIIDSNIGWFMKNYNKFMPRWFLESYRRSEVIPQPRSLR